LLAAAGVALGPEADEAATEAEAMKAVEYLLELGADLDVVDREGDTVMHAAAYKQAPNLVKLLAEKGAEIEKWNRKNKRGWTPLIIAQGFRYGNFKPSAPTIAAISEVMLAHGVTPPAAPPRPVVGKREAYQN
jgi:ankyrin repeat protein